MGKLEKSKSKFVCIMRYHHPKTRENQKGGIRNFCASCAVVTRKHDDKDVYSAQEWKNRTPNATNLSIVYFLLLPGSQSSFTEITEYVYFSLI